MTTQPNLEENQDWKAAKQAVASQDERIVFITGPAGSGKSTLLEQAIALDKEHGRQTVVAAPTGVAANRINGVTLHRFFSFPVDVTVEKIKEFKVRPFRKEQYEIYKCLEHLIIDEVSFLRADLMDCIEAFLSKYGPNKGELFGGVKLSLFGDLCQLPPVVTRAERDIFSSFYQSPFFYSAHSLKTLSLKVVELKEVFRQSDPEFVNLLLRIRVGKATDADLEFLNSRSSRQLPEEYKKAQQKRAVLLTPRRDKVKRINQDRLDELASDSFELEAEVSGDFPDNQFPTDQVLSLKQDARIMLLNNDPEGRWHNGTLGYVVDLRQKTSDDEGDSLDQEQEDVLIIRLDSDDEEQAEMIEVGRMEWTVSRMGIERGKIISVPLGSFTQFPVQLAWGSTIHKSQGLTLEHVTLDTDRGAFADGQFYVALSRCTSLDGLMIEGELRHKDLKANNTLKQLVFQQQVLLSDQIQSKKLKKATINHSEYTESEVRIKHLDSQGITYVFQGHYLKQYSDIKGRNLIAVLHCSKDLSQIEGQDLQGRKLKLFVDGLLHVEPID